MDWHRTCCGLILGIMLFDSGCGPSGRSPLGKVTGTVTYKGEPVEEALIVFHNPNGRSANGRIENGEIKDVTTYDVLSDGAPLGSLTVTIHSVVDTMPLTPPKPGEPLELPPKPPFPPRYGDPQKSVLEAEIQAGTNELSFDLTD